MHWCCSMMVGFYCVLCYFDNAVTLVNNVNHHDHHDPHADDHDHE